MAHDPDDPEQTLRRSLDQIEDAADQICRGIAFFDPDRVEDALGSEAGSLRDALARLMEDPGDGERDEGDGDLVSLVADLVRLIDPDAAPLQVRVVPGQLPPAAARPAELRAAVRRLLQIGVAHAGSGGTVTVDPRTVDGDPALELVARPAARENAAAARSPTERCRSLVEFAGRLGGRLELIERDRDEIAALLRFPRSASPSQ